MLKRELHLAKSRRDAFAKKRLGYRRSFEDNVQFLRWLQLTETVACEAAFMALTQGLATALTRGLATSSAVLKMERVVEAGGRGSRAVTCLARLGQSSAAPGAAQIAQAASNTLARVFSHCVVQGGRATTHSVTGGGSGRIGNVTASGFALGLALALFMKPGALTSTTGLTKQLGVTGLASAKSLQALGSATTLLTKGWNGIQQLTKNASPATIALLGNEKQLRAELKRIAEGAALLAFRWVETNQFVLMKRAEIRARRKEHSDKLPGLLNSVLDLGNARGKLKSDAARYASADVGYRLWRGVYDLLTEHKNAAAAAAKNLSRQRAEKLEHQNWKRGYNKRVGYRFFKDVPVGR